MCSQCEDQGLRAWRSIGADNLPLLSPPEVEAIQREAADWHIQADALDRASAEELQRATEAMRGIFGNRAIRIVGDTPEPTDLPPVRTVDDILAVMAEMTAEFWRDTQLIERVAIQVCNDHPSGRWRGIPWDMIPERVRNTSERIAKDTMYLREIVRRIDRGLPALPDVYDWRAESEDLGHGDHFAHAQA